MVSLKRDKVGMAESSYANGGIGDLKTMLIKYEIFSEDITRFYMAELTLALGEVHRLGFIHR